MPAQKVKAFPDLHDKRAKCFKEKKCCSNHLAESGQEFRF